MQERIRVFHISPEWCGQERLVQLFRMNGFPSLCHEDGRLAEDIVFAKARRQPPLQSHDDAWLVTGLYRSKPFWRPPLEAWREFAFLDRHFPQARFILTTRDPDAWLFDRLTRDKGAIARAHACHRGVAASALPDLWLAEWQAHLQAVQAYFGDDPRLIRVDLERETPQQLCQRLSDWLPLPNHPARRHWMPPADAGQVLLLQDLLEQKLPTPPDDTGEWVADVADFCLRGLHPDQAGRAGVSRFYCEWDGAERVLGAGGQGQPIAVAPLAAGGAVAVARAGVHHKLERAEGVINDALRLGRRQPLSIDMEDSRWMGSPQGQPLGAPVLCHNRRHDSRNVVLWPLPGQHDIGMPGFDPHAPPDRIAFEDKEDRLVWRGMISGSRMRDGVKPGPASHTYLTQLAAAPDEAARQAIWAELSQTSRLAFVRRWIDHPDFDLGVVMAWGFREFARDPLLAPYCKPRRGTTFFRRFRYQLCLGGYDHGSNFMTAINSRSVLLAEDDGWEVFYSGRFKPWKHFIPVARYGADIAEKLAWARRNPKECTAMSQAGRAEAVRFADPDLRRQVTARILDALAPPR